MATVRDYVRAYLPATYEKMTNEGKMDDAERPDAVGLAIQAAADTLLADDVEPNSLPEFGKRYLAAVAVVAVIPSAIDYYMVQTRLNDGASRPSGVTPLGGESSRNYDRIDGLEKIEARLRAWISSMASKFLEVIGDDASVPTASQASGIWVSGDGEKISIDARLFKYADGVVNSNPYSKAIVVTT
jgi:hypothetical protein